MEYIEYDGTYQGHSTSNSQNTPQQVSRGDKVQGVLHEFKFRASIH